MNKMTVSPLFSISPDGPRAAKTSPAELVHLRQGDIDGACGPYCMCTGLITLGLVSRAQIQNMHNFDGRTREGRFRDALMAFGVLVAEGTIGDDLVWLTDFFKTSGLKADYVVDKKKVVFSEVTKAVDAEAVPIIGVRWEGGGGHWLTVVGYQGIESNGKTTLTHLLCLDPGQETPKTSLWNSVLEVYNSDGLSIGNGSLSSVHWTQSGVESKCHIEEAVILKL